MVLYGVVGVLVAPHKEEEDLVIPVEEGVDTSPVPQKYEKPVLVSLLVLYSVIFTSIYALLSLIFGGLSELPFMRSGVLSINWSFWLLVATLWLVGDGIIFFMELFGDPVSQKEGDRHQINITLYRLVMKYMVVLIIAVIVQAIGGNFKFQILTVIAKIALDISLIVGGRKI